MVHTPNGIPLRGSAFVVTGGASGLGRAAAEHLAKQGAKVALWDMNEDNGAEAVEAIGKDRAMFAKVDVTSEESVTSALEATIERFGCIRGVVNSAGVAAAMLTVGKKDAREPHPLDIYENVLRINLTGTFNVCRLAAAAMSRNEPLGDAGARGVLVNVASLAGYEGQQGQVAYAASKGGVIGMAKPMARDLGQFGIRVVVIAPGTIETPMAQFMRPKVRAALLHQQAWPKEKLGDPEAFAHMCGAIIENEFWNGTTVRLDGGAMLAKL